MIENWHNFFALVVFTGLLIVTIESVWRLVGEPRGWSHEVGRKAHHVGIGVTAVFMPDILLSRWTGWGLGLGFGALLLAGYRLRLLRSLFDQRPAGAGGEIIRRYRHSWIGPAAFSTAVALVSLLFWEDRAIYRASLLVLALGDAAATVFGLLFGRHRYHLFGSRRSLEGNMALVVLASAVCLAVLPDRGPEAILFAWMMGVFLCVAEAISPVGMDNLALPLATAAALTIPRPGPTGAIDIDAAALVAMALVTVAAATLTAAHLRSGLRQPAVLAMGAAVLLLAEMGHLTALALLGAFTALVLGADFFAPEGPHRTVSTAPGVLVQLVPSAGFVALSAATGNPNFLVGSLASLTVVGRNCWGHAMAAPGPATPRASRKRMPDLALEMLSGMGAAWAALLLAGVAAVLFDLGRMEASVLAIVFASAAGGLLSCIVQRAYGGFEPAEEPPLIQQFVPALLAVGAVPAVSLLLVGLSG